jgi:diguanylate cyclase (GGDEF)-like protein
VRNGLCSALAKEGAALLGARAAALVTLPAAEGADVDVALAGAPPRRVAAARFAEVAAFAASGETHRIVRNAEVTTSGYDHMLLVALGGDRPVRVLTFADVGEEAVPLALAYAAAASGALTHQAEALAHRRAADRQAALTRAAKTLNGTLEFGTLLGRICEEASTVVEADSAVVYRLTHDGTLTIEAAHGLPPEHLRYTMPAGEGLAGKVLLEDRPMMTEDYGRVGRPSAGSPWNGVQASMAVPVHLGGRLRGVLSVAYWRRARLGGDDLETLATFAELAAVAFGNAHRQAGLEEAARTDPLTGCLNHAALHEGLAREIGRTRRTPGARLSLVLLDLDRFKEVNDEHGHLVGDEVLRRVGHALRTTTRPYDLAARYGGDEFALVAIDADEDEAREIAERAIERITFALGDLPDGDGARATAGVAGWHAGLVAGDLIAAADPPSSTASAPPAGARCSRRASCPPPSFRGAPPRATAASRSRRPAPCSSASRARTTAPPSGSAPARASSRSRTSSARAWPR